MRSKMNAAINTKMGAATPILEKSGVETGILFKISKHNHIRSE